MTRRARQGAPVLQRVAQERQGARGVHACPALLGDREGSEQSAQLGVPDDGPYRLSHLDADALCAKKDALNEREVVSEKEIARARLDAWLHEDPCVGAIREQACVDLFGRQEPPGSE
jgi:hypothetical protein